MAERRLAAILMADIVGYTRLMNADERGTHERVQRLLHELVQPTITEHRGRLVKTQGDGFLVIFDSPVEAVRCAIVIQQSMVGRNLEMELPRDRWIQFRIGVNVGDVIVEPDDIYGDGVNVAQRLEALADPGTIYISGSVYEQIRYKLVCGYQSLGDKRVKNILDPVPTYKVLPDPASVAKAAWRGRARLATVGGSAVVLVVAGITWWYFMMDHPQDVAAVVPPHAQPAVSTPPPPAPTPPIAAPSATPAPAPPTQPAVSPPVTPPMAAPSLPPPASPPAAPPIVAPSPPPPAPSPPPTPTATPPSEPMPIKAQPVEAPKLPPPINEERVALVAPPPVKAEPRFDEPKMIVISGGVFRMGSMDDPSEQPIHSVIIKPFLMSKSLITVRQWRDCVAAKACSYEPKASEQDDAPMNNVSWNDAQEYIGWLSKVMHKEYRLPSEAEWEYAARGGTETKYWWGNSMKPGYANCIGCGGETAPPSKIGNNPANPYGLYISDGSLGEWVADCWVKDYHGAPLDNAARMIPDCRTRVLRSGSWRNDASYVRSSSRDWYDASVRYPTHGFRVARSQ